MPFIVEFSSNINSCIFGRRNTSVKFVAKIAHPFRGQIDPLIIFGRDILNFIAGLGQWRGLAQTLLPVINKYHSWKSSFCYSIQSTLSVDLRSWLNFQLFVLRLPCTFQGIMHPPHLACLLIKGNNAGYQSTCIPRILKTNELSNILGLLYASI